MAYNLALRQKLAPIAAKIHKIIDKAKAEGERGLTSEERLRWDKLVDEYSEVESRITVSERSDDVFNRLSQVSSDGGPVAIDRLGLEEIQDTFRLSPSQRRQRENERDPHARAFAKFIRGGIESLEGEDAVTMKAMYRANFQNTMSTTTGSQGGYTVPQGFSGLLEEAKKWFGGIGGIVGKFRTGTGNPWPWPTVNDTTNRGRIIGQNQQVIETDLVFGQQTFNAYIGSSDLILIPLSLMDDSYFDMDALVAKLLGIRLGRLYNWKCTVGTGSNEPTGIVPAVVAAGNVLTLTTGSTASIAYSNLVDLEHSVDPAYRESEASRWMFSDTMLKLLKKLVDQNQRPLWQPGLTASFQQGAAVMTGSKPKILEHEYVINQDMATPAANAYSMLFGDMSTFMVRELVAGTTVMRLVERYADYLQVGFIAFQRFDSQLVDAGTHPIAVLQQSAQ